jgi:hypothetical protein
MTQPRVPLEAGPIGFYRAEPAALTFAPYPQSP